MSSNAASVSMIALVTSALAAACGSVAPDVYIAAPTASNESDALQRTAPQPSVTATPFAAPEPPIDAPLEEPPSPRGSPRLGAGLHMESLPGQTFVGGNVGLSGAPSTASNATEGTVSVGELSRGGASVPDAEAVVSGMATGFRACYQRGLAEDPGARGELRLTVRIGADGRVLSAALGGGSGLSTTVLSCVQARAKSAAFSPLLDGDRATIAVPLTFRPGT